MADSGPARRTGARFGWVGVSADRSLTGNQLALIPGADDLDESVRATITREFNRSGPTFIVRTSDVFERR